VLIVFTVITAIASRGDKNDPFVPIVGDIPDSIDSPALPSLLTWDAIGDNISPALILALIGYIEGITVGSILAQEQGYSAKHEGNQELVAIGIGNLATGMFGSFAWCVYVCASE
jgi:MFS superfamily sulfate permease-like transporter